MTISDDIKQKLLGFWLITLLCFVLVLFSPPISQNLEYHDFADQRRLMGIDHFWNVMSNLPFLVVGYLGVKLLSSTYVAQCSKQLLNAYRVFFVAIAVVGLGSMYYHLQPNNQTLLWDRLPMTIAFMAFFSLIIGEYINEQLGQLALLPLVLVGVASVVYWYLTEQSGHGDLRFYAFIQFAPMLLIPYILLVLPARYSDQQYIWAMLATYLVAKVFEALDMNVFAFGQVMGGHAIKHICAALGPYLFYQGLKQRHLLAQNQS